MDFYGTIEATGDSKFRFLPKEENDWDTDSTLPNVYYQYFDMSSVGFNEDKELVISFVSEPLDIYAQEKYLGLENKRTYWKCFLGEPTDLDHENPSEHEFDLEQFSVDKARRVDAWFLEAFGSVVWRD